MGFKYSGDLHTGYPAPKIYEAEIGATAAITEGSLLRRGSTKSTLQYLYPNSTVSTFKTWGYVTEAVTAGSTGRTAEVARIWRGTLLKVSCTGTKVTGFREGHSHGSIIGTNPNTLNWAIGISANASDTAIGTIYIESVGTSEATAFCYVTNIYI